MEEIYWYVGFAITWVVLIIIPSLCALAAILAASVSAVKAWYYVRQWAVASAFARFGIDHRGDRRALVRLADHVISEVGLPDGTTEKEMSRWLRRLHVETLRNQWMVDD